MKPHRIQWPDRFQAATMVSVELDHEFIWHSLYPETKTFPKITSMGTIGITRGLNRVLECLKQYEVKATFFVPGAFAEKYPEALCLVAAAGHEIALHGYEHENFALLSPAEQRNAIERGTLALEKLFGVRPKGFRLPQGNMTPETYAIIQEAGFSYDSSMLDNDVPYQTICDDGRKMTEIPIAWEMEDFAYFTFSNYPPVPNGKSRMSGYRDVLRIWQDELDGYYNFGLCYVCKFDPAIIGTPGRIGLMEKLLCDIREKNIWVATGAEIDNYIRMHDKQK